MPIKTITVERAGTTSTTIGVDRTVEAGVNTILKDGSPYITVDRSPVSDAREAKPLLSKVGGATLAFALYDLYDSQGDATICKVEKRAVGSSTVTATQIFTAKNLVSKLEDFIGVGYDGYMTVWYNQAPHAESSSVNWTSEETGFAPRIVYNGSVHKDRHGSFSIDGKTSRMKLGHWSDSSRTNILSSDGSFSLFLVGTFSDYSGASRNNVQILNLNSNSNGGANNTRTPFITIDKSFNKIGSSVGTFTVGGATTGNVYGGRSTLSDNYLISNIANPTKTTLNNMMWIDGDLRTTTDDNTVSNTETEVANASFLFDKDEVNAGTSLRSMIYYPSDKRNAVDYIHSNLLNKHDIT